MLTTPLPPLPLPCSTGLITMPAWMAAASLNAYGGNVTAAEMEALQAEVRSPKVFRCLPHALDGLQGMGIAAAAHG